VTDSKDLFTRLQQVWELAMKAGKVQDGAPIYVMLTVKDKRGFIGDNFVDEDDWEYWMLQYQWMEAHKYGDIEEFYLGTNDPTNRSLVVGNYNDTYEHHVLKDDWETALREAEKWATATALKTKV
jgi:hypothetical protein